MAYIERIIEDIEQSNPPLLTWTAALIGSITVGLSGVVPIALLPINTNPTAPHQENNDNRLKLLLSFAVGGLLGDVFLHLFPEAYAAARDKDSASRINLGMWILGNCLI